MATSTTEEQKMSVDLKVEFQNFFEEIELIDTQQERIDSAVSSLSEYLGKCYDISSAKMYTQGSFSTNSTVKPTPSDDDGEYDVDLVVECVNTDDSPEDALSNLKAFLLDHGTYKEKIENKPKLPCIRLRYADEDSAKFHVDILPAQKDGVGSRILIPRRGDGWKLSDPAAYTKWILELGENYRRTVMMFKRWRDENKLEIKSIVLQTLVAGSFFDDADDQVRLAQTLIQMNDKFSGLQDKPTILNPVLSEEVISDSWDDDDFTKFQQVLGEHTSIVVTILNESDHDKAALQWQEILGGDFKFETANNKSLSILSELGDVRHAQVVNIIPRYPNIKVKINAHFLKKYWGKTYVERKGNVSVVKSTLEGDFNSMSILPSNGSIDYRAEVTGAESVPYRVMWQVVNTGEEATFNGERGLRGQLFFPQDINEPMYDHEVTQYEGVHWIECFVVVNDEIVARSGRFYIKIFPEPKILDQITVRREPLLLR